MKRFVEGIDRGQATLFPECLEDWIDEDNPVRVIDAFVEKLDLSGLGFDGVLKKAKRVSHIDPPASSNAIMRRARPYRGENPEPGKDVTESLTPRPELENDQDPSGTPAGF